MLSFKFMKILLTTGGDSSEREVSLSSANNVKAALEEKGHEVTLYDLRDGYDPIIDLSKQYDVLFPVLHGEEGEGEKLHEFLSKLNKPIVGTRNYKGLHDAWHKIPFKEFCEKYSIATAPWKLVETKQDVIDFGFPSVIKASNGGSSKEVLILNSENDLDEEFDKLMNSGAPLFVERKITGIEATVGILNGKVLPIIEIVPPTGQWFSYDNKYASTTQEIVFAPSVPDEVQKILEEETLKIWKAFDLGSYFRTDYMVRENETFALDVNTIPGLTAASLMPKQAKAAGISFGDFLEELLRSAK